MQATKLQKAIYDLLKTEPFYAHFILNSKILYDAYKVPTAGVCVTNGTPTFVFNTKFMDSLSHEQVKEVLKHECLHLLMSHLDDMEKEKSQEQKLYNIAQDCAINQYLGQLPEGCVTLDGLSKVVGKPLEAFQTSKYYYDAIKDKQKEMEDSGLKTVDDHDMEGVEGEDTPEMAKAAVQNAAKKALGNAAGNAPDFIVKEIANYGTAQIPWQQVLKNFILTQVTQETQSTHKRMNRRFPLPVPGKKKKRNLTLGVCTDSSGSVSDAQYSMFMTEVKSITNHISKTWLIHADCQVQHVEELKKNTKTDLQRRGGGGTAYQPAISKAMELKSDVIIYFGDFDTSDTPEDPKRPFLWVGVGNQDPPAKFGKVIRLSEKA